MDLSLRNGGTQMREKQRYDSLDRFRILAAALVVAIHTSPFTSYSADADFFLTRVLGRIAVPFFFMVTGQFVVSKFLGGGFAIALRYVKKIALLYGAAILLYLPVGIYAGHYKGLGIADGLKLLIFDGTFYHLWYFPACILGVLLVYAMGLLLYKNQDIRPIIAAAGLLYAFGLLGDSYYGLAAQVPVLRVIYEAFFTVFSYTRNGIFMAPIFLLLGVVASKKREIGIRILWAGLLISFLAMTEEAFLLRHFELQRHDSMYIFLIPVMFFLYQLLLATGARTKNKRRLRHLGTISTWIYILHPAMIVVVRGAAKAVHLPVLAENSLIHYLAVLIGSAIAATVLAAAGQLLAAAPKAGTKPRKSAPHPASAAPPSQRVKASAKPRKSAPPFQCGRAWIEIDHKALQHNVSMLRSMLPPSCKLMPAVKADAYGHGALLLSDELQKMGVSAFCVASVQEGATLRRHGIDGEILILGYTHPQEFPLLCQYQLAQTVIDYSYAKQLNNYGASIHVHIGVDTGMHRIGERSENAGQIAAIFAMEHLMVDGMFTHLCTSDTQSPRGQAYTDAQVNAFFQLLSDLKKRGITCPKIHMLASYGIFNYPQLAGDYARVGIALYGVLSTAADTRQWQGKLQPVLSLKARIATVKTLYAGESAGYGIQFTAGSDMQIATIAIGYADGLPRALSCGAGSVLIKGHRAPIIGRICMDQAIVDISGIEGVQAGDTAVIIGRSGTLEISACDLAQQAGTISNEILSRLGARLERILV